MICRVDLCSNVFFYLNSCKLLDFTIIHLVYLKYTYNIDNFDSEQTHKMCTTVLTASSWIFQSNQNVNGTLTNIHYTFLHNFCQMISFESKMNSLFFLSFGGFYPSIHSTNKYETRVRYPDRVFLDSIVILMKSCLSAT